MQLGSLRAELASLFVAGPGNLTPADYRRRIRGLIDQGDALEANLAQRSAPLRAFTALPLPDQVVDRVAASLPENSALIEFVAYIHVPLTPKIGTPPDKVPQHLRYLAFVLFPDARIRALDLGPAAPIDRAASRLRDALATRDPSYLSASQALYHLTFKPLLPLLGDVRRVFLAPDGQLGFVSFAALHDGRRFLLDSFHFTYLTSGKSLLSRLEEIPASASVVVFADPTFTTPLATPVSPGAPPEPSKRSFALERFVLERSTKLAAKPWASLPGTREEALAIQRFLPQAQLFLGTDATKDRLLQLQAPGVLHVATHGFFLESSATPATSRGLAHFGVPGAEGPSQRSPDPLLRSGLVLAGANAPAPQTDGPTSSHVEDSLATALELAGINLWGTQLVVLSACDTGRGDVKLGQGVYGLRRAFVIAGAETLVTSLWKVNDETTRALMESYYGNLIAGKGRSTALHEAMLNLREQQPHPYYWAPFIAIGKDAPLQGLVPLPPERATP